MGKTLLFLALLSWGAAGPTPAMAQEAQPDSARIRAVRAMVMSDLRNFVVAQEAFYAENHRYANTMSEMRRVFAPSPGVTIVLLTSSDLGHSEIAIHADVPDLVCAMYVGNPPPPLGRGREGEVACRGPGATR